MQVDWHLTYLPMLLQTLFLKVTMRFRLGSRGSQTLPVGVWKMRLQNPEVVLVVSAKMGM